MMWDKNTHPVIAILSRMLYFYDVQLYTHYFTLFALIAHGRSNNISLAKAIKRPLPP